MAAQSTFWNKTKTGGKAGWDKLYSLVDKLGPPVNKLSNKLGSEAFWPTSQDKECDKAARILRSFCADGFYQEEERPSHDGPKQKQKVLKKIPSKVIQNAVGLAIFTTMRTGLWIGGSGGSGVLVARKADGSWSPPSGIQVQTMGLGFLVGVDIYDCVIVINTRSALEGFTRVRATLGGDLSVTAGPVGAGALIESEVHARQAPIFTYLKSRGFYAGVQIDGTVVIERVDENERFYGERIPAQDILKGKVRHPPVECKGLLETLKAAEGDDSFDPALVPTDLPPSDYEIHPEDHTFGVPDRDDPDPYGVLQLEKEGMVIREAGTQKRASWEQFTFSPAITSPVFETFDRRSNRDSRSSALSRRSSAMASPQINGNTYSPIVASDARSSRDSPRTPVSMSDAGTQTDDLLPPPQSPSRFSFRMSALGSTGRSSMDHIPENEVAASSPSTHSRSGSWNAGKPASSASRSSTPPTKHSTSEEEDHHAKEVPSPLEEHYSDAEDTAHAHEDFDEDEEEEPIVVEAPVVHSIQRSVTPKVLQRARMVDVPKRGPPPMLPPRNPNRTGTASSVNSERPPSQISQVSALESSPERDVGAIGSHGVSPVEATASTSQSLHHDAVEDPKQPRTSSLGQIIDHANAVEDANTSHKGRVSPTMPGAFD